MRRAHLQRDIALIKEHLDIKGTGDEEAEAAWERHQARSCRLVHERFKEAFRMVAILNEQYDGTPIPPEPDTHWTDDFHGTDTPARWRADQATIEAYLMRRHGRADRSILYFWGSTPWRMWRSMMTHAANVTTGVLSPSDDREMQAWKRKIGRGSRASRR